MLRDEFIRELRFDIGICIVFACVRICFLEFIHPLLAVFVSQLAADIVIDGFHGGCSGIRSDLSPVACNKRFAYALDICGIEPVFDIIFFDICTDSGVSGFLRLCVHFGVIDGERRAVHQCGVVFFDNAVDYFDIIRFVNRDFAARGVFFGCVFSRYRVNIGSNGGGEADGRRKPCILVLLDRFDPFVRIFRCKCVGEEAVAGVFRFDAVCVAAKRNDLLLFVEGVVDVFHAVGENVHELLIGVERGDELDNIGKFVGNDEFGNAENVADRVFVGGDRVGIERVNAFSAALFVFRFDIIDIAAFNADRTDRIVRFFLAFEITESLIAGYHGNVGIESIVVISGNDRFGGGDDGGEAVAGKEIYACGGVGVFKRDNILFAALHFAQIVVEVLHRFDGVGVDTVFFEQFLIENKVGVIADRIIDGDTVCLVVDLCCREQCGVYGGLE